MDVPNICTVCIICCVYSVYTRFCDKLLFSSNLLIRTQTDAHCCAPNGFAAVVASHHFQMNQIQI